MSESLQITDSAELKDPFYGLRNRRFEKYELPPLPILPELPPIEETLPRHLARRALAVIVYAMNNSPFFAEKYRGFKPREYLNAEKPEDFLTLLPPLEKGELTKITDQYGKIDNPLFTRKPYGIDYNTGGTSDHKAGIIYEKDETDKVLENIAELLKYVYIPGDRVAIASGQYSMWGGFPLNLMMWPSLPYMRVQPVGGGASSKETYNVFMEYRPTVIAGLSSSILSMLEKLKESPKFDQNLLLQLKKIQFAGMPMTEDMRKRIEEIVGHDILFISHYTGSESWCTGLAIDHKNPQFIYLTNNALVEVLDSKTLNPVSDGEEGILAITRLYETLIPMARYLIGDWGRIVSLDEYPPEERIFPNARVIELLGRANKQEFIMAGLKVDANALIYKIKEHTGAQQAQIVQTGPNSFDFRILSVDEKLTTQLQNLFTNELLVRMILSNYFKYYPINEVPNANDYFSKSGLNIRIVCVSTLNGFELTQVGKIKPFVSIVST